MPYSTIDETTTVLPPIPEGDVIRMAVENNKVIVVLGPRGPHAALVLFLILLIFNSISILNIIFILLIN